MKLCLGFGFAFGCLGPHEHLVVVQTHLLSAERNVEAAMRLMNLAGCEATIVVATTNVQWLSLAGTSTDDSTTGHIAKGVGYPTVAVPSEQLKVVLHMLTTSIGHVGAALAGNDLCKERERKHINKGAQDE